MTTSKKPNKAISLETQKRNLLFNIGRSIRYNIKRQRFFECWERGTNFLTILCGSSTVYAVTQQYQSVVVIINILLTALSSLGLVIGFSNKARDHRDFAKQYLNLKEQLTTKPLTQSLCDEIKLAMQRIDLEEPPVLVVLEQICYNEQINMENLPKEKITPIRWYQRILADYVDICSHRLMR